MQHWQKYLLPDTATVQDAIALIGKSVPGVAIVIDTQGQFVNILSDATLRKAVLMGVSLADPLQKALTTAGNGSIDRAQLPDRSQTSDRTKTQDLAASICTREGVLVHLDQEGRPISIKLPAPWTVPTADIPVLLMVGGNGHRLRPLTDNCPKPLLKVGGKPILQRQLESLVKEGFKTFYFSVHYRAEMIEEYFGDGRRFNANITYLKETQMMGTAGSVKLIPNPVTDSLIVMNGDLFTDVSIAQLVAYHKIHKSSGTMAVAPHEVKIPYGVVETDGELLAQIREKPTLVSYINAGMYVLEREAIDLIPDRSAFDMPSLFDQLLHHNLKACAFPLREEWIDIGSIDTFELVCKRFQNDSKTEQSQTIDFAVQPTDRPAFIQ